MKAKAKPLVASTLVLMMSINAAADISKYARRAKISASKAPSCSILFKGAATSPLAPIISKAAQELKASAAPAVSRFNKKPTIEEATKSLKAYKETVMGQILEREYVLEPFMWSLIAKEHILLIGPPGNAKTTLAKALLSNIVDESTGQSVFYSMQMNKEITLSDTHGSINYKTMSDKGLVERNYAEGILGAKLAFIDESFDIRPGALRNLLDVLAERGHSQGTKQHKGLTEVVVAATNKTLPEVYEEHNNSEGPRALVDRFAQIIFVPKEMENIKADRAIFRGERAQAKPIHQVTFAELDVIRALVPKVQIPDHVADLAAIIHFRLAPELEAREVKSSEQYREKIQNGEYTLPPFRASKYMSPRTLGKAGNILKAIVVSDYVAKDGKRSLTATTEDLAKLRKFYQMGGPNEVFLDKQLARSLKEHEKEQIKSVKIEREVVDRVFDENLKEFNESLASYNLQELDRMAKDYKVLNKHDRNKLMDMFKLVFQQGLESYKLSDKEEITPANIASAATLELIKSYIHDLKSPQAEKILAKWEKDMTASEKKKYLSAKAMRKQLYRYGYDQKNEAGLKGMKSAGSSKFKGKVQFEQVKEYKDEAIGTYYKKDFDILGDQIVYFKHEQSPTYVTGDFVTSKHGSWNTGQKIIKALAPDRAVVVYENYHDLYQMHVDGNYQTRSDSFSGKIADIVKSPVEADTYFMWGEMGLLKFLVDSNGEISSVDKVFTDGNHASTDFNIKASRLIRADSDRVTELVLNPENGLYVDARSTSTANFHWNTDVKLLNLSGDVTLMFQHDSSTLYVANLALGKVDEISLTEYVKEVIASPDRALTAVVYADRIDIYKTDQLASSLANSVGILGEPAQTLSSGSNEFAGARFADDGSRLAVKTHGSVIVFENNVSKGK
jgi:MoxR-like ATPases